MPEPIRLAVLGDPIAHSRSPAIHRLFGRQLGLEIDYQRRRTRAGQLGHQLTRLRAEGVIGVNLTVPMKIEGLDACQQVAETAARAGAVNTLQWSDAGWQGYNTDGPGLLADLARLRLPVEGQRVLMLGAGGASAGILGPLLEAGPAALMIVNRGRDRARRLCERFAALGSVSATGLDQTDSIRNYDLLLQCTSAGHDGQPPPLESRWLNESATVYDLNYGSAHEPLRTWAENHVIRCHDGFGMLVGQAALAFEIWTGQLPDVEATMTALSAGL